MSALDEYDIRKAFDALDEAQDGFITLRDLQTLYLGLGYFDEEDEGNEPTLAMLRKEIDSVYQKGGPPTNYNELSIETVVQVLSKVCR